MTLSSSRNLLVLLDLLVAFAYCAENLNISGEAITTRFWDCCKPSCGWEGKAAFSAPVQTCDKDNKPTDKGAGTGCNGGTGYLCSDQHPWAVNDSLSYGFAGVFLTGHPDTESYWCCACFQLNFTSDPLIGKTMIVQASNTAYDVKTANRFSLAMPGGNTTSEDGCTRQYGLDQTVFGQTGSGVASVSDCDKLPDALKSSCQWRFNWFKDASYPKATFKRVVCPAELTNITKCTRNDEKVLAGESSLAVTLSPATLMAAGVAIITGGLLSV